MRANDGFTTLLVGRSSGNRLLEMVADVYSRRYGERFPGASDEENEAQTRRWIEEGNRKKRLSADSKRIQSELERGEAIEGVVADFVRKCLIEMEQEVYPRFA